MVLNDTIWHAIRFAVVKHAGQVRKDDGRPYVDQLAGAFLTIAFEADKEIDEMGETFDSLAEKYLQSRRSE